MRGFCPLASGSTGNAIYLGTEKVRVLFDAGISFKALQARLEAINVPIESIDAVIISHEHTDHIRALEMLTKKVGTPVFCNSETAKMICQEIGVRPKMKIFSTGEEFTFSDLEIHPFSIQHDTPDPVAFTVKCGNSKIGICTDLGFATKLVETHLHGCDYLYLEANHDEALVHASSRPLIYKQRVLSKQGHLSNSMAGELISKVHHSNLKHVWLAHLSTECNTPELALKTVQDILAKQNKTVPMSIAHPDQISHSILF